MKESTKLYLVNRYNRIPRKTKATCLKYHYLYNNVNVNVYFDAFETKSVALSIVLAADKKYYYTSLNILKHLDNFYENMEKHLLEDNPYVNYYNKDTYFVNTIKYAKSKLDLPFWWCLRKVPMSDDTLKKLNVRADITLETLQKIQHEGYTLVRTADPEKRKELTLILQQVGIELS